MMPSPRAVLLASLLALSAARPVHAEPRSGWRQDLDLLARELPRRHMDFFKTTPRAQFADSVRALRARLPHLSHAQFMVGVLRLVAMAGPGNGHTYVLKTGDTRSDFLVRERNTPDSFANVRALGLTQLPVGFYDFRDGLYVRSATAGYEDLLGAKVIRIGNRSAEDAMRLVAELVAKDNAQGARADGPRFLAVPQVLEGLGLVASARSVPIEVRTAHGTVRRALVPVPPDSLPATRLVKEPPRADRYVWSEEMPGAWYVRWSAVRDQGGEKLVDLMNEILDRFDRSTATKLVLDVRDNPGGNTSLDVPILQRLIRSPKLRERGSLFVITGRETFSAAMNFCLMAERFTPAVFVGEPTGGAAGFFGDNAALHLPHLGVDVRVSYVWWQLLDSRDTRPWLAPTVWVEPTAAEYASGRDLALEAALAGALPPDYGRRIVDAAREGRKGVDKALGEWRSDDAARGQDLENALNAAAYTLLGAGRTREALGVLDEALALYPRSWNLYDSRGEARVAAGDTTGAITDYRHSFALNPRNFNAEEQLAKLRAR